jgi:hypothetical protein
VAKRIVLGLLVTLALLAAARRLSTNKPREIRVDDAGPAIIHETVFEQVGPGEPAVRLLIDPAGDAEPFLLTTSAPRGDVGETPLVHIGNGVWEGRLPSRNKGERLYYAFRVDIPGQSSVRLPRDPDSLFLVKYKGEITGFFLVLHVIFMFGAFFFMVQSFWGALRILSGSEGKPGTVQLVRWVILTTFVGGWPIGFILNYQRFGMLWEGFPFGYDITDNKTQIIFLFWIVTVLLVRGSFFGGGESRDSLGARGFAWAVIVSFVVSLTLYMVPHSL